MGFSRQEYWSGLPFPSPGDLPNPGIEPASPVLAGRLPLSHLGSPTRLQYSSVNITFTCTGNKKKMCVTPFITTSALLQWSGTKPTMSLRYVCTFVKIDGLYRLIIITPNPQFTLGLILGVVHSVGLNKRKMTCIHHYGIKQYFHCPKNPASIVYPNLIEKKADTL